jgi:hypothetical protein
LLFSFYKYQKKNQAHKQVIDFKSNFVEQATTLMTLIKSILQKNGITPKEVEPGQEGQQGATGTEGGTDGGADGGTEGTEGTEGSEGGANNSSQTTPPATTINEDDLTDDLVLRVLNKRKGTQYKSLDELNRPAENHQPSEEELRQQQAERQNNIRAWALQKKKVTSTDFDQYAQESSVPYVELAADLYKSERLAALKAAGVTDLPTDEALQEEFDDLNFQFAKPDDPKRITAEKRLKNEVDGYLQDKYSNIYDLEDEFSAEEAVTTRRTAYDTTINQVFTEATSEFAELTFEIAGDKKDEKIPYKFKVSPELLNTVRAEYSSDGSFAMLGQGTVDAANIKAAVKNSLITKALNEIVSEVANAHANKVREDMAKGRRNIVDRTDTGSEGGSVTTNPVIKKLLDKNKHLIS